MSKLSLFVRAPVLPSLGAGLSALAQSEQFSIHALKIDFDLFPLLLEARPCVLLASISDAETNSAVYQFMKDLKEYREGQGAPARDPTFRIVIVSEGNLPRLNWSQLGIHELMVGPVAQNVLQYKLSRHHQKAIAAAADELSASVDNQTELRPVLPVSATEKSAPWRLFKAAPTWKTPEIEKRIQRNELSEKISVRVRIPGLETKAGEWKRHENLEGGDDLWEWVEKPQESKETRKQWTFVGTAEPEFSPEDGSWQFKGSRPKLLLRKPDDTQDQVFFEYLPESAESTVPALKAALDAEVKHAKIERLERRPEARKQRARAKQIFQPLRLRDDEPETSTKAKSRNREDSEVASPPGQIKKRSVQIEDSPQNETIDTETSAELAEIHSRNLERAKRAKSVSANPDASDAEIDAAILDLLEASSEPKEPKHGGYREEKAVPKNRKIWTDDFVPDPESATPEITVTTDDELKRQAREFEQRKSRSGSALPQASEIRPAPEPISSQAGETGKTPEIQKSQLKNSPATSRESSLSNSPGNPAAETSSSTHLQTPRPSSSPLTAKQANSSSLNDSRSSLKADPTELRSADRKANGTQTEESTRTRLKSGGQSSSARNHAIQGESGEQSLSALFDDEAKARNAHVKQDASEQSDPSDGSSHVWKFRKVKAARASSLSTPKLNPSIRNKLAAPAALSAEEKSTLIGRILQYLISLVRGSP